MTDNDQHKQRSQPQQPQQPQQQQQQQPESAGPLALLCIGGGNMATALVGGLLAARRRAADDTAPPLRIVVVEPDAQARSRWAAHPALSVVQSIADADALGEDGTEPFDVVLLAVKPQQARDALHQCAPFFTRHPGLSLLSIAAGLHSEALQQWSGLRSVARAMPNTPALIGEGVTGLWLPAGIGARRRAQLVDIARAAGECVIVDREADLDAVTAVSGSGPAYFFYLIEAMARAGVEMGLDAATAERLALGTARGAAGLALQSDVDARELRRRVSSAGGTTEAAIAVMDAAGMQDTVAQALQAARQRSRELSGR